MGFFSRLVNPVEEAAHKQKKLEKQAEKNAIKIGLISNPDATKDGIKAMLDANKAIGERKKQEKEELRKADVEHWEKVAKGLISPDTPSPSAIIFNSLTPEQQNQAKIEQQQRYNQVLINVHNSQVKTVADRIVSNKAFGRDTTSDELELQKLSATIIPSLTTIPPLPTTTHTPKKFKDNVSDFSGDKNLDNDGYKIFLSKKYNIKKNDLFNKFEVNNSKLVDSLDDALLFAFNEESKFFIEQDDLKEISSPNENWDKDASVETNLVIEHKEINSGKPLYRVEIFIIISLGVIAFIAYSSYKNENQKMQVGNTKPSFDCSKAKSPSEKLICSDNQLAKEDNELLVLYQSAKFKTNNSAAFKAMTITAWKEREANCFDKRCVLEWYASRKVVYQNIINGTQ